jgi:hypothetical protein
VNRIKLMDKEKKMKRALFFMVLMSGIVLLIANPVQASLFTMEFEVDFSSSPTAPTNPVIGSIGYDAASINSVPNSLNFINMIIDGHNYTIGEVGVSGNIIGGIVTGVNGVTGGTDDFWLVYDISNLTPLSFIYSSLNTTGIFPTGDLFNGSDFTKFIVSESTPVPEPSTMMLLGSGLVGLVGYGRRRFKK